MSARAGCGWVAPEQWPASAVGGLNGATAGAGAAAGLVYQYGLPGWFGAGGVPAVIPVAAAAGAGAVVGFVVGYCLSRILHQLTLHRADVCVSGLVKSIGQDPRWYLAWLWDPDKTFNLIVPQRDLSLVTDGSLMIGCTENGTPFIHCEIVSAVQRAACIGGMVGAAAGAVAGIILGIAAGAALGCGPFAFLCLLLAALIALIVAAIVTAAASWAGGEIGAAIGSAIDARNELIGQGDSLSPGDCVTVQGDWVLDNDTYWNEIHPVKTLRLAGRTGATKPFTSLLAEQCPDDCTTPPVVG
jgi:hypothetical protein